MLNIGMIDQRLIDTNQIHLSKSLDTKINTNAENLFVISDALDATVLEKLWQYVSSVPDHFWQKVEKQESRPRFRISWDPDTVIEELHEIFNAVTPKINRIFSGPPKNFWGVSVWKDLPGYELGWHTDNADIDVAVQIYLYVNAGLGTVFISEEEPLLISSNHNSGYMVLHTGDNKMPHRTQNIIPEGIIRYSLYAVWSRLPKHTPDAQ
jgi:hypothetical protein